MGGTGRVVVSARRGGCRGWGFFNNSTSRIGFLLAGGRIASLVGALVLDGLKLRICLIPLLVEACRVIVALKPFASGLAVIAFLTSWFLTLVAALARSLKGVKLSFQGRQALVLCLQLGAESLYVLCVTILGAGESYSLVIIFVLALYVVLGALDGVVGVVERQHGVRVHKVGQVLVRLCPGRLVFADLG